jgi:glycosidase
MQWSAASGAGFTSGTPWIKLNEDYKEWNVEAQLAVEERSVLGFWKRLLGIRKQHPALVTGTFTMFDYENQSVYAYTRANESGQYLVVCSFSDKQVAWKSPVRTGSLLLGNYPTRDSEKGDVLKLRPFEGRLYHLRG